MPALESEAEQPRRVFLESRELPGLVAGTALAEPAACRRVLGARRGGRAGVMLALAALALAAGSVRAALVAVVLHVALTLALGLATRRARTHTTREIQRLALWTVVTPLSVAALARLVTGPSELVLGAAVLAGQALLLRALAATTR